MRLYIPPFSLLSFLFLILMTVPWIGYSQVAFEASADGIPVQYFQDQPMNPWAGGINSGQFSNIDLDLDGVQDVLVFDREGDRILPFVQEGTPGFSQLVYHPELREAFPPLKTFVLARDFDQDGKMDLFSYQDNGIIVYKNSSTLGTGLQFSPFQLTPLMSNVPGNGLQVIEIPSTDIPVLEDLDGDGDLDIVTFNLLGTLLDYHKNLSVETFGNPNSLAFILEEACWGHVMEDDANNSLTLGVTCKTGSTTGGNLHAGSSILT
ncbi:MAG: VCBS repeat-containing protein, partial [Bacteroidota bacterium]